jgi:prepilin-type N-terminal cleavage/methylation domain-containing protein
LKKAFTLIELLIVVAIIAILAAIAVPNFLEAQTRSKVSRVKADMRSIATAVESYYVDYTKPPPMSAGWAGTPFDEIPSDNGGQNGTGTLTPAITTPVSYLSNFMFKDVFVDTQSAINIDERLFTYQAYQWKWPQYINDAAPVFRADTTAENGNEKYTGTQWREQYGAYKIMSIGPDRNFYNVLPKASGHNVGIPYDPTNGTISMGNITRSQKQPEHKTFIP